MVPPTPAAVLKETKDDKLKPVNIGAILIALFFSGQGLTAQNCSFGNEDMDDIQRIRRCMEDGSPEQWPSVDGFTMLHRAARYTTNPTVVSVIREATWLGIGGRLRSE